MKAKALRSETNPYGELIGVGSGLNGEKATISKIVLESATHRTQDLLSSATGIA